MRPSNLRSAALALLLLALPAFGQEACQTGTTKTSNGGLCADVSAGATHCILRRKSASVRFECVDPSVAGLAGPAGPAGATGATGATGAAGATGPAGAAGAAGADGADGSTILSGSVAPTTEGANGDFYLDTTADQIYGPKAAGAWGAGTSLVGPQGPTGATGAAGSTGAAGAAGADGADGADGKTVLNGSGAPGGGLGTNGDFYLDTATSGLYGPKTAGSWGSPVSLIGPTGAAGATGSAGATGATGPTGPQGDAGPAGATGATGATGSTGPAGADGVDGTAIIQDEGTPRTQRDTVNFIGGSISCADDAGNARTNCTLTDDDQPDSDAEVPDGITVTGLSGTNSGDVSLSGTPDYLTISGQTITRGAIDLATDVTGLLPEANGGTGLSALAAGIAAFLGTPSSANLRSVLTDESGTGASLFAGGNIGAATGTSLDLSGGGGSISLAQAQSIWFGGSGAGTRIRQNASGNLAFSHSGSDQWVLTVAALVPQTAGAQTVGTSSVGAGAVYLDESGAGTETLALVSDTLSGNGTCTLKPGTVATLAGTETLTNKTLTDPQVTSGDVISGTLNVASGAFLTVSGNFGSDNVFDPEGEDSTGVYHLAFGSNGKPLSNGTNDNVNCSLASSGSFVRVTGPTSSFTITGIIAPTGTHADGRVLVIYNSTSNNMTIANAAAASTAANRILTGAGDIATTGSGSVTLMYSTNDSRWVVVGSAL